jgi:succinate dehydrogenase/fumarate reductase flavoprotein subunit
VLTDELRSLAWDRLGLRRDEAGLAWAADRIGEIRALVAGVRIGGPPASNAAWQELLDLQSRLATIEAVATAASARAETRGVHIRRDHPARDDAAWLRTVVVRGRPGSLTTTTTPVALDRLAPDAIRAGDAR